MIIKKRKALPELISIATDICTIRMYSIKYKININETTLTYIYYDIFSKICQPSPVFLYLVRFYCYTVFVYPQ
jgi:hypothetical protein